MSQYNSDSIERIRESVIHHGKYNNRIYIMKLEKEDIEIVKDFIRKAIETNNYTKVIVKTNLKNANIFLKEGYEIEGEIRGLYGGKDNGYFVSKFYDDKRKKINKKVIDEIVEIALRKKYLKEERKDYIIDIKELNRDNAKEMVKVYKQTFTTYPFPIFDEKYLIKTMGENVKYFGAFYNSKLVGISSAECSLKDKNAEMTDFAVLEEDRGKNIGLQLLIEMEKRMLKDGYKTLYTIARSHSYGMNITFSKNGYKFGGTLKNNTNIYVGIESMNIWYKNI